MSELSQTDAEDLRELAAMGAWWRHDTKVRTLVARGVTPEAIAWARDTAVQVIEEIVKDDSE